jgi:hypothetical protein
VTYPQYVNSRPAPSRAPGCAGKFLILALAGAVVFVLLGGGKLIPAAAVSVSTPATTAPTIRPIAPELNNLEITQAALDVEGTQLAYNGTALANLAVEAQVTQQAAIFGTQLARDAIHAAMTETTEAQQAERASMWVQETQAVLDNNSQIRARVTLTAEAWQATAAVATYAAIEDEWNIAERKRTTAEWWAGIETVVWRIVIPLAVAVCVCLIAGGFTTMLTRRYGVAREIKPEVYQPEELPDADPLNVIPFTKVMVPSHTGNSGRWVEIEVWPEKLAAFAQGVVHTAAVAERYWTGSKGIFSLSEYDKMRDGMILNGLGHWNNPAYPLQGWSLTAEGRLALGLIARPPHSPSAVPAPEMA